MDLLDLYRGTLTYRRLCALVTHLPADAAVWRAHHHDGGYSRTELLLAVIERRVTVLWVTLAVALGHTIPTEHMTGPLDITEPSDMPKTVSLRDIANMMQT
ncbi:hypothetical protein [Actinokineospora inagensis]|uniref:hypothetical protein n=1 Tax=Actinokineospora inagensis TaxID=103730 RepID=UPI00042A5F5C|nr:hypothetical protein [Actinokineospora inagensis]